MPHIIPWAILCPINLRPNHSTQIPDADLQRIADGTLRLARDIAGRPG